MRFLDPLLDHGMPEPLLRFGIRRLLKQRLKQERESAAAGRAAQFMTEMDRSPIALETQKANDQHYEVPPRFFELVLGPHLKYSAGLWNAETKTIAEAEENMLQLTLQRAGLKEGQDILELGCGWGSLTLYTAKRLRASRILAVSNSHQQREFILQRARSMGLANVEVVTSDMNCFHTERKFDRIVSVEMLEHMRNYRELFRRVAGFLNPDGKLFVHIFVHRAFTYPFVPSDASDWMARHFFSGGMMPSADLLLRFQDDFRVKVRWPVSGAHYQKTAEAWLRNHEKQRSEIEEVFEKTYGAGQGSRWWNRWKIFFLSCSELWGYRNGEEWFVCHYLLAPNGRSL